MVWSIPLIDTATSRAFLACVGWVDENDGNPGSFRFVDDERSELCERPVMQAGSLTALGRYPSANSLEIFKGYPALGAFGSLNDLLRYYVISMLLEPRLFPRKFTKAPFGRLSSSALEAGSSLAEFDTQIIDTSPRVDVFIAICGDICDAKIDAKPIDRIKRFGLGDLAAACQVPFISDKTEVSLSLAEGKKIPLSFSGNEFNSHPAFQCPDGQFAVTLETDDPLIIWLRSIGAEDGSQLPVDLKCVGDLGDTEYGGLGSEVERTAQPRIAKLLQIELPKDAICKSLGSERGTGVIAPHKSLLQRDSLFVSG